MIDDRLVEIAVEEGIIDRDFHVDLLARIDHWARVAGVRVDEILSPVSKVCGAIEIEWARRWQRSVLDGIYGLVYVGPFSRSGRPDVAKRMRMLCAGLMRHYVDARVMTVRSYLACDEDPEVVLLMDAGSDHAPNVQREVGALVVDRAARSAPTIVHVADLRAATELFGGQAGSLVRDPDRFMRVDC